MEEIETVEYYWYVLGCAERHLPHLLQGEFFVLFERYTRCEQVLRVYESRRHDPAFWRQQGNVQERRRVEQMFVNAQRAKDRLEGLKAAVLAGRRLDMDGGAGVPACLHPVPRPVSGTAAKQLPYLDTEPDVRNPWPE